MKVKYSKKLFFATSICGPQLQLCMSSIGLSSSFRLGDVQFVQCRPQLGIFVVPDDKRGTDGEKLALPALLSNGNHGHPRRNACLHAGGGVLKHDGVLRRDAKQLQRPEVRVREGLKSLALLGGDDELEEVREAEDGDHEVGVSPGRVGDGGALEPTLVGPAAERGEAGDLPEPLAGVPGEERLFLGEEGVEPRLVPVREQEAADLVVAPAGHVRHAELRRDGDAVVVAYLEEHLRRGAVVERVRDGHGAVDVEEHGFQGSHSADPTAATTHRDRGINWDGHGCRELCLD